VHDVSERENSGARETEARETDAWRLPGGQVWDESARPTAPLAPGGYPYSRRGKLIGNHLKDVHDHLRAELSQVRDLLRQVKQHQLTAAQAREQVNELSMRQNNWTLGAYCAQYCAIVTGHHGLEDQAIFPHLRQSDPGLAPVIDQLEAEHVIIHEVLTDLDRVLVKLITDPGELDEIEAAVDALTQTLLSHLAYEEREITEPLSRFGFYSGQV
jgi:hemerythrin-like domain-containing protein